ncbi:unnamed protein product [Bemisia tabaci]|uniref:Uncharacterized protein n=1 Tax=Bemisia tabaci TaxID=7038 RepID=A0AAI8Y5W5_BEMTA|nr:unnamed protein product [Bemisia tabaci]
MQITMSQSLLFLVIIVVATVSILDAVPVSQSQISSVSESHQNTLSDALSDQDVLTPLKSSDEGKALVREKRTIGFLRTLFPGLSQLVDRKIQQITRWLFRVIGRLVLRGGNNNGGGSSSDDSGDSGGRKVSIVLPTYPPAEDEEDTDAPTSDSAVSESAVSEVAVTTTQGPSETENQVAESKTSEVKVRKTRQTSDDSKTGESSSAATDTDKDLDTNETSSNDDTNADVDDNEEAPTEDDGRNKRFLFNLGGGGGSGGGSGNFLFDIIRLVAGSGTTQDKDEQENAPLDSGSAAQSVPKEDGYSAGVPGPLTRLFVIANRGIANLIQDLILRLAQTSERIVNFKARLITSII